ncbi:hypothetical protein CEXT_97021 [Caerostris extrusa]|uniref:Uncharacterized protein n=1 Tax=Caerostris extrusa TaxID=172846 RepID=A0AAV4W9H0_CAEEX|nr:hypothetical protein CEXT_97021 [Caerostris extrusa]
MFAHSLDGFSEIRFASLGPTPNISVIALGWKCLVKIWHIDPPDPCPVFPVSHVQHRSLGFAPTINDALTLTHVLADRGGISDH